VSRYIKQLLAVYLAVIADGTNTNSSRRIIHLHNLTLFLLLLYILNDTNMFNIIVGLTRKLSKDMCARNTYCEYCVFLK